MQTADLDKPEPLQAGTVVRLMGWPWMVALIGLFAALALAALTVFGTREGWPAAMPWLAMGVALVSSLLALLAGPRTLARILDAEIPPGMAGGAGMPDQNLVASLQALLEREQTRARDATAALGGVVNLGNQMAGLVREVERRLKTLPDQAIAAAAGPGAEVARELLATERRLAETLDTTGSGLQAMLRRLAELADRLEAGARADNPARMEALVTRLERWLPAQENATLALTEGIAGQLGRVEDMLIRADRAATESQAALADCSQHLEPGIAAIRQLPQLLARAETVLDDRPLREVTQALACGLDRVQAQLDQASEKLDTAGGSLARYTAALDGGNGPARLGSVAELAELREMVADLVGRLQAAGPGFGLPPAAANAAAAPA